MIFLLLLPKWGLLNYFLNSKIIIFNKYGVFCPYASLCTVWVPFLRRPEGVSDLQELELRQLKAATCLVGHWTQQGQPVFITTPSHLSYPLKSSKLSTTVISSVPFSPSLKNKNAYVEFKRQCYGVSPHYLIWLFFFFFSLFWLNSLPAPFSICSIQNTMLCWKLGKLTSSWHQGLNSEYHAHQSHGLQLSYTSYP